MKHKGKLQFIKDGQVIAEGNGNFTFHEGAPNGVCVDVDGQLCFPILQGVNVFGPLQVIPIDPPQEKSTHTLVVELNFETPEGVSLTDEERERIGSSLAGYFSHLMQETISNKTPTHFDDGAPSRILN